MSTSTSPKGALARGAENMDHEAVLFEYYKMKARTGTTWRYIVFRRSFRLALAIRQSYSEQHLICHAPVPFGTDDMNRPEQPPQTIEVGDTYANDVDVLLNGELSTKMEWINIEKDKDVMISTHLFKR